jgi:hypothetical protein
MAARRGAKAADQKLVGWLLSESVPLVRQSSSANFRSRFLICS